MNAFTRLWTNTGLLCLALVVSLADISSATTYTVTTATDHPVTGAVTIATATGVITGGTGNGLVTLRSAVIAANKNGVGPHTINVPAGLGTYNLSQLNPDSPTTTSTGGLSDLQVGSNLSTVIIQGTGGTAKIVQNVVSPIVDVITTGFKDASYNPAIVNLTLDHLEITGGTYTGIFTGADDGTNRSSTTITNCNIHDNTNGGGFGQGGAIFNQTGSLSISATTFTNNAATSSAVGQGGAIFYNLANASGTGSIGSFSVTNCTFNNNTSAIGSGFPAGGAIFLAVVSSDAAGGAINITGCTFNGNKATTGGDGGAIAISNATSRTVNITKNNFISNQVTNAAGGGGAIEVQGGTTNINFNRFITNTATTATNGLAILHKTGNTDPVNADDNWWTVNTGPGTNDIKGAPVTVTKWLQLTLAASPTTVAAGGTSTLTASFLTDSASGAIAAGNLTALVGLPITFGGGAFGTTSGGNTTIQAAGTAATTFTAGPTAGSSSTTAQVDSATANATVSVQPVVASSSVGLPITAATVTFTGSGFSTTPANNTVAFNNGATGTVTTASTTTQLTVTFGTKPAAPGSLTAIVTTNGVGSGAAVQVAVVIPVITSNTATILPNAASLGITGFGFNTTPANNTMTFSGAGTGTGIVSVSTATSLTTSLPATLIAGPLNASMTSGGFSSGAAVQVATVRPVVTSNLASLPASATTITIIGAGFSTTPGNNTVAFTPSGSGTVTGSSATSLTVTSLSGLSSGPLNAVVTTNGVASTPAVQVATVFVAPTVNTPTVANITATTATLGGNVTANGGGAITARGVVYAKTSQNPNPQIGGANVTVVNDAATTLGTFSENISGLSPGTGYSFVAFATNAAGTGYTGVSTFSTLTPLNNWRLTFYGTTSNTGNAADAADPYHTGVPNLAVFGLFGPNQDPAKVAAGMLPQPLRSGGNFVVTVIQPAGVSGVTYGAEWRGDLILGNWTTLTDTVNGSTHTFSVPLAGNPNLFMRLRVSTP